MTKLLENLTKLLEGVPKKWIVFLAFVAIVLGSPNFWPTVKDLAGSFQEPKMGVALSLTTKTYQEMNRIRSMTGADKVLLLRAHDSGRPRPGITMQSSIIHEVWDNGVAEYYSKWQNQVLDEEYIKILQKIYDTGSATILTSIMADSDLRDVYISLGITHSRVVKILITNEEIFYMTITWSKEPRELTPTEEDVIRSGANNLTQIIKKGEEL